MRAVALLLGLLLIPEGGLIAAAHRSSLSLSSLSCTPMTLGSGATTTCTVALTRSVRWAGSVVSLSSNNSLLSVPASVTIAPGNTTATFPAAAGTVANNQTAIVTASFNGSSQTATIGLASSLSISLSPTSPSLSAGQTQQFAATVTGGSGSTVTWALSPAVGSISQTGLYTAPATISTQQSVTVTATSAADTTKSATALVTLNPSPVVSVSVTPGTTVLNDSQTQQFTAAVTGTSDTVVTWSLSSAAGSISSSGLYTAPGTISATQTITVTANSAADPSKSATATVTLKPQVHLSWTASTSTGVSGYNLYRGNLSGGPYTKINPALVAGTAYIDANVAKGNFYYYVATAVNSSGQESPYSVEAQVLVQ